MDDEEYADGASFRPEPAPLLRKDVIRAVQSSPRRLRTMCRPRLEIVAVGSILFLVTPTDVFALFPAPRPACAGSRGDRWHSTAREVARWPPSHDDYGRKHIVPTKRGPQESYVVLELGPDEVAKRYARRIHSHPAAQTYHSLTHNISQPQHPHNLSSIRH